jgi:hypothetical protein
MTTWQQRLRGAIGIGLTWAAGWAPVGALTGAFVARAMDFPVATVATNYAVAFAALGLVGGAIFSILLSVVEGRRYFSQLSLPRFVLLGGVGGLVLGGLAVSASLFGMSMMGIGALALAASTMLGAGSAAVTLGIAMGSPGRLRIRDGDDLAHGSLVGGRARPLRGSVK